MNKCLIVCSSASDFQAEIERLAPGEVPATVSRSAEEAMERYDDEPILFGDPRMIAQILPELGEVRWVQSTWAGVKPLIDIGRRDYLLTGVKDIFGPQMAEYVLGYLLAHELRITERLEAQKRRAWDTSYSGELNGKRLGVMGTGSIGGHIARCAAGLGLRPLGLSRSGRQTPDFETVYPVAELSTFLANCDYLVSTLPQTPATDGLLDAASLSKLPRGACFVNVGRSNVVDDEALIDALESGHLAGATLDVFDEEPLPTGSPLWDAPNLLVTAHIAAVSHPGLIVPIFLRNYRRFGAGEPLDFVIDLDAGY